MSKVFQGKHGGAIVFLVILGLVSGGLAWVTAEALRLEREQAEARADAELFDKMRLALWRLDSQVFPILAKEVSRPFHHYSAISPPNLALGPNGKPLTPGAVLEPSPLLSESLPDWIVLHFQTTGESSVPPQVFSPQVLSASLRRRLETDVANVSLTNVTPEREQLLAQLRRSLVPAVLLAWIDKQEERLARMLGSPPAAGTTVLMANNDAQVASYNANAPAQQGGQMAQNVQEFNRRFEQQQRVQPQAPQWTYQNEVDLAGNAFNGEQWLAPASSRPARTRFVSVSSSAMVPYWLTVGDEERLAVARRVNIENQRLCQGFLVDWRKLTKQLAEEVHDLFPEARLVPVKDDSAHREQAMSSLPFEVIPGPNAIAITPPGWTPLRFGLTLAWLAALVALAAVGLGGWSLFDLSERRMRFVSAVTHELRTPLTTLRLYLDMLNSGMVQDEARKVEYLQTLHAEAERLHKLVANVLDFARLENQRTQPEKSTIEVTDFLEQLRAAWASRCREAGKELIIENHAPAGTVICTDARLLHQIVGNLVENACKYSRSAKDPSLWVRVQTDAARGLILEVEDRGPGVPAADRRAIFRPFHRGHSVDVTAEGVGLGLALAERWSKLLGGRLTLRPVAPIPGACFRIEITGLSSVATHPSRQG